jgi:hypothetical protein
MHLPLFAVPAQFSHPRRDSSWRIRKNGAP